MRPLIPTLLALTLGLAQAEDPGGPAALDQGHFEQMGAQSPFLRTLGSLDSVVLTGVVRIDAQIVISVIDTETRESRLVSETRNLKGWKLVDSQGACTDLPSVQAKIRSVLLS